MVRGTTKATVVKARTLRRAMSPPEAMLWRVLRERPAGLKFRRQHPVGPFVLDFYCPSAKVAIEVDGVAHEMGGNVGRDLRRDRWLGEQGVAVLRVPAAEVLADVGGVVAGIVERCGAAQKR